jgi:hypothetical protein
MGERLPRVSKKFVSVPPFPGVFEGPEAENGDQAIFQPIYLDSRLEGDRQRMPKETFVSASPVLFEWWRCELKIFP